MAALSIGELAARTGVSVATLRSWETRHGFPAPGRTAAGRRLYTEREADAVVHVAAQRRAGLALEAAIGRARRASEERAPSVYATLQSEQPELVFHMVPKRALMVMARAVEDEHLSRGGRGVVLASFQQERFYRQSEHRWRELTRSADLAAVYAAAPFGRRQAQPWEIPVEISSPMQREWVITCASPRFFACLAAWERPSAPATPDGQRRFEVAWTTRPASVLQAVGTFVELSRHPAGDFALRLQQWSDEVIFPPRAQGDTADALANRMVAYMIEAMA